MKIIIEWICFISVVLLVGEVMLYLNKELIKNYKKSITKKAKPLANTNTYVYKEKIAK